jgi:hypothetical protein
MSPTDLIFVANRGVNNEEYQRSRISFSSLIGFGHERRKLKQKYLPLN